MSACVKCLSFPPGQRQDAVLTGGDADVVPVGDLYTAYKQWAGENGYTHPLTSHKFAAEVESAFPRVGRSVSRRVGGETVRVRVGLRRRPEAGGVTRCDGLFADASQTGVDVRSGPAR